MCRQNLGFTVQLGQTHGSDFSSVIESFLTRLRLLERVQEGLCHFRCSVSLVSMSIAVMDMCHRKRGFSISACRGNLTALTG